MKGTTRGDLGRIGLERTFYGRALPVIVALIMLMSSVAIAGVTSGAAAPSNARAVSPSASPSVAYGSMVSLNFVSETGPVLGGTLDALPTPPLAQSTTIVVNLPFENQTALNAFIEAVSDPYSPSYAHFLTPALFTREYSPPLADQQLVAGYLTSSGLTVTGLSPDHLSITATGTLAQLETAFDVTFAMYAQGAQTFWAPTSSPSVPSNIAPWIFGLVGLTDHASGLRPQLSLGSPDQVAGTGLLDYPNQMNWDFQLNQLYNATGNKTAGVQPSFPKGVTITQALWDEGLPTQCGYSLTDIDDYFGDLVSPAFPSEFPQPIDHAYYNVTGDPGEAPGTGACDTEGAGGNVGTETIDDVAVELTVDQEYSGEDAPGATLAPTYLNGTTLDLTNPEFIMLLNYIAAGNVPNLSVVTQSFGGNETVAYPGGEEATGYADYQELAATGVTVLASSGDDNGGSATMGEAQACESGGIPPGGYGVPGIEFPGSTPDLLSVGGTATMGASTPADPDGALTGQTVWNWCPSTDSGTSAGSTGGVSLAFPEAYYQEGIPVVNSAMLNAINVTLSGNGSANSPGGANDGLAYSATNARPDPDVAGPAAMDAVYFGQSWVTDFGGTSFSSPATAGVMGSIVAFDGHRLGMVGPALYSLESQYIAGKLPLAPTYFVRNYSNAFFNGGTYYNTSAGWGVPQAYNLALLLGKPFVSTNPQGPATVGAPYPISARVVDDRDLSYVNVSYLEPGATSWSNASLSLSSGTAENGTWSGAIGAPAGTGVLKYCVYGIDQGMGNSWSPYNQSAWVATGGKDLNFGCTVPFTVNVHASTIQPVTFTESGLTSGTSWTVTVNSTSRSSTGTTITFHLANGGYTYTVGVVPHYTVNPTSGSITVSGAPVNTPVKFTSITKATYAVTFAETGLPSGHEWNVTLMKIGKLATTGTSIVFLTVPNGTYSYRIAVGYPQDSYKTTFSGTVTVNGAAATVNVKFTQAQYKVTFEETGLASGTKWTVDVGSGPKTVSGTGTSLSLTLANGTYTWTASASGYDSPTGPVMVNGATATVMVRFT
ncbi:MAG: protease pro-enzyme activation domain-containing protein [Thermoplasmata archaeon]